MEAYSSFAQVYDLFMDNVPYEEWSRYLISLLKEYQVTDGTVVELGCGTGKMTRLLADAGYDMVGVDNSAEMLEIAGERQEEEERNDILYLLQDMRELDLYSTVGTVISVCDSVNYILEEEELLQVSTMGLFTTVIKVICAAAAGLIAVRRCKKRLWLYGALAGTLYAVLAFIVFSAVAGTLYVSIALLSDIAIGAVSGLLSVMVLQMLK